jgi:hypothetical protein
VLLLPLKIESTEKCQTIKEVKQCKHILKDSSNDYDKNLILNKIKNLKCKNKIYLYKFLKQNDNEMEWVLTGEVFLLVSLHGLIQENLNIYFEKYWHKMFRLLVFLLHSKKK